MPSDPSYVHPFGVPTGGLNSMRRWDEMNRRAGTGQPAPSGAPPSPPQNTGILQGLLSAIKSYMGPKPAAQAPAPQADFDTVMQQMRDTTTKARQVMR